MDIEVTSSDTSAEAEALKKNIIFFCSTPRGSLPQMRGFGLDFSMFDESFADFRVKATVDIVTGVREYFGVNIDTIDITSDEDGNAKVKISI